MEKPSISFFVMCPVLLFAVASFILVVFELHGLKFAFELAVLLAFMFFLAFGMYSIYHEKKWGWTIIGLTLILLLINIPLIALISGILKTPLTLMPT